MRLVLLATASAMVLLTASPARADLSPSDLGDAASHIVDSVVEAISNLADLLCQVLVQPAENLPELTLPVPPRAPVTDHVDGEPVTQEQSADYASQRIEDRTKRVEALDSAAKLAASASQTAGATMQTLSAANVTPLSVLAGIQINTAMAAAAAGDQMAATQLLAAQVGMQADQALQQEHERAIAQAQSKAILGEVRGGGISGHTFKPRW